MAIIPLIILGVVLVCCVIMLLSMVVMEVARNRIPYKLFKLHAKLTTRGKYRIKRSDDYFKIYAGFSEMRVTEYEWDRDKIRFQAESGYKTLFEVKYNTKQQKIESFDCSPAFAKGVNNDNFLKLLETYIPYVLEHECGKKSDRVLAVEKVKQLGQSFEPKLETPKETKNEKKKEQKLTYQLTTPSKTSSEITFLIGQINQASQHIQENKYELEIEAQHQFEMLLTKRLPNLLKHATSYEREVKEALQDVLHKFNEWQNVIEEGTQNDVEKELLLIKKITHA